jgi:signal transduction histidine kinase
MQGTRGNVKPAGEFGLRALRMGLKPLDLAMIHRHALTKVVTPGNASDNVDGLAKQARTFTRAEAFFIEAIRPIDLNIRTTMKANVQLNQLNETLRRRTTELAAANRKLKREVVQRQKAEAALKKSQQHHQQLLEKSQHMQGQLRHLAHQLLRVQEEERKEISRELHDQIAQTLTGINVHLATLKTEARANTKGLEQKISRTQRLVEQSVNIVHRFARDLRPTVLDDLGLIPALHSLMKEFTKQTGIRVQFSTFAGVEQLNSARRTVLYRVTQSALANVAQHAKANCVKVSIRKSRDTVRMDITDDGKGFEVERVLYAKRHQRLGLLGMRERVEMVGGSFGVESGPGQSTSIHVRIPLANGKLL